MAKWRSDCEHPTPRRTTPQVDWFLCSEFVTGVCLVFRAGVETAEPLDSEMVGTGRFELPTPRTPSECSTRLSHVPTWKDSAVSTPLPSHPPAEGFLGILHQCSASNHGSEVGLQRPSSSSLSLSPVDSKNQITTTAATALQPILERRLSWLKFSPFTTRAMTAMLR